MTDDLFHLLGDPTLFIPTALVSVGLGIASFLALCQWWKDR